VTVRLFTYEAYCADPIYGKDRRECIDTIEKIGGWVVGGIVTVDINPFKKYQPFNVSNLAGRYKIIYNTQTIFFEIFEEALMVYLQNF
jgi:hypothetical protein